MTAQIMARAAYASPNAHIRTARDTEYDAFARVTHRLKAALDTDRTGFPALALALHDNRRLWATLAADVADDDNGLPRVLRARIFSLAEFCRQHSARVLSGAARAEVLVDINTAMMRGLRPEEGQP